MNANVIDERQIQLAIVKLRIAQTHVIEALAKNPEDASLNGVWESIETAIMELGSDD